MSNVVELKAHRRNPAVAAASDVAESRSDLRALQELQALCALAIEAGGLDAGGPTALDLTVAIHGAMKGTDWAVRFHRQEVSTV